jgi:putative ABC transport system ATP-binding protein
MRLALVLILLICSAPAGLAQEQSWFIRFMTDSFNLKVAIARELIINPKILIADEPTGNLDSENGIAIFDLFRSLVRNQGVSVVVTSHNLALGYRADRIITLADGKIVREEQGPAQN